MTIGKRNLIHDIISYHIANGCRNEDELLRFSSALLWGKSPIREACCANCQSPWDFITSAFFNRAVEHVIIASRASFKTSSIALLNSLNLLLKPGISILHLGARLYQAQRGNQLTRLLLSHAALKDLGMIAQDTKNEIMTSRGSRLEVVAATISAANGPRANFVVVDEFELIQDEQVLNEVRFAGNSYGKYKAGFAWLSSLKRRDGYAAKAADDMRPKWHGRPRKDGANFLPPLRARQRRLLTWCYRDTAEPCPEWRRGTKREYYEVEDLRHPGELKVVHAFEKCRDCPLLPSCGGSLANAKGSTPIDDLIGEFLKVNRTSWLTAKECTFAEDTGNRVHPEFTKPKHVYNGPARDPRLPTLLILDPGGGAAPTALGFYGLDYEKGTIRKFAELVSLAKTVESDSKLFFELCKSLGIRSIHRAFADPTAGQAVIEWNERLLGFARFKSVIRPKKVEMVEALSALVAPIGGGPPRITYHSSCKTSIRQMLSYRKKPYSEEPVDGDDDCVDCDNYAAWVTGAGAPKHQMHALRPHAVSGAQNLIEDDAQPTASVGFDSQKFNEECRMELSRTLRDLETYDDDEEGY